MDKPKILTKKELRTIMPRLAVRQRSGIVGRSPW
jgi:hypothetical protein